MKRLRRIAEQVMFTWTMQDVEAVLDTYVEELVYIDPNTRGPVMGKQAMRSYLTKLYGRWDQSWRAGDIFPLEGVDGVAIRWSATLAPKGSEQSVEIEGIDLVILEADLIRHNEVFFDRALLAPLLTTATP